MDLRQITKDNFTLNLNGEDSPWHEDYLSMYSSQWKGFTTDPDLMMIPIDDHLVHRGDGAFDVMRCVRGRLYQMEEHLTRLRGSASAISIGFPPDFENIRDLIKALLVIGGEKDSLVRVILSRGPGSFTTNPYDCPSSQLYINVVRLHSLPDKYYREGLPIITSSIPIKKSFFANIKSCNYLQNVLMKKEAVEAGCKYSVALDEHGFLAEGSTENIGVLTKDSILKFPEFERTLSGKTVNRVFFLAGQLVGEGLIKEAKFAKIDPEEAYEAKEIFLTGTSIGVLPVVSYDGRRIGIGSPGSVYARLSSLLWEDMTQNRELLTEIEWDSSA